MQTPKPMQNINDLKYEEIERKLEKSTGEFTRARPSLSRQHLQCVEIGLIATGRFRPKAVVVQFLASHVAPHQHYSAH
jgi:hypothetical protein